MIWVFWLAHGSVILLCIFESMWKISNVGECFFTWKMSMCFFVKLQICDSGFCALQSVMSVDNLICDPFF
jgi:hypothetical protein